jgi:hypothetical protein
LVKRNSLCIVFAGISLTACGGDATDSSAVLRSGTDQTSAAGTDESLATADDVVTIPVSGESDVAERTCDGIGRALGEMAAVPGAAAEMFGFELLNQLSSLLTEEGWATVWTKKP